MTFLEAREFAKRNHLGDVVLQLLDAVERTHPPIPSAVGPQGELTYELNLPDGSIYQNAVPMDTQRDAEKAAKVIEHIKTHIADYIAAALVRETPQQPLGHDFKNDTEAPGFCKLCGEIRQPHEALTPPPPSQQQDFVRMFLSKLESLDVNAPEVRLEQDGDVGFDWDYGTTRVLSMHVSATGRAGWAALIGEQKSHGTFQLPAWPVELAPLFAALDVPPPSQSAQERSK